MGLHHLDRAMIKVQRQDSLSISRKQREGRITVQEKELEVKEAVGRAE